MKQKLNQQQKVEEIWTEWTSDRIWKKKEKKWKKQKQIRILFSKVNNIRLFLINNSSFTSAFLIKRMER